MSSIDEHKKYIAEAGSFHPTCSHQIFSIEEWDTLCKYGNWFKALTDGVLKPFTAEQEHFVSVAKGEEKPITFHENVWFKYRTRKEIEQKYGAAMHSVPRVETDTFHNREGSKKMKWMQKNFGNPAGKKRLK